MSCQGKGERLWDGDKMERLPVMSHAGDNRSWNKTEPDKTVVAVVSPPKGGRMSVDWQVWVDVITYRGYVTVL